jgi:hypothetical protein
MDNIKIKEIIEYIEKNKKLIIKNIFQTNTKETFYRYFILNEHTQRINQFITYNVKNNRIEIYDFLKQDAQIEKSKNNNKDNEYNSIEEFNKHDIYKIENITSIKVENNNIQEEIVKLSDLTYFNNAKNNHNYISYQVKNGDLIKIPKRKSLKDKEDTQNYQKTNYKKK